MEDKNQELNAEELKQVAGGNAPEEECPNCKRKGTLKLMRSAEGPVLQCKNCQGIFRINIPGIYAN